jgi:tetratricopeptide (TPR) repeat protein
MRRTTALACLLACSVSTATFAQTDDEKRAAMNAAYRQYQELIAQGPQMRAQAEAPAREAFELALEVLGDAHATTAALAMNYGNVLADGDAAARVLGQALEITENLHGDEALELVDPLMALGDSATANSEFADARGHYARALEIAEGQPEPDPFLTAIIAIQLGTTAFSLDRPREAIEHFTMARDNLAAIDNDIARVRLATAQFWIGRYHIQQEDYADALGPLQESLATFERFPEARQLSVNSLMALVEAHERLGQRAAATPHVQNLGPAAQHPR